LQENKSKEDYKKKFLYANPATF